MIILPQFLQRKVDQARAIIDAGLAAIERPYVACSWGKDSTVMLYFILQARPDITVMFMDSGYHLPDTYEFRDRILREWKISNYIESSFPVDQLRTCRELGLGVIARDPNAKRSSGKAHKRNGFDQWAYDNGYDGVFWGMRASESNARRRLFKTHGPLFRKKTGECRCAPLAWWSFTELWAIKERLGIPHNGIYDKTLFQSPEWIRSSGWLTMSDLCHGRIPWLRHYYPEIYARLLREFPEVAEYG